MNHNRGNRQSRPRACVRGVSPIIATILLVAITVVLAAVLYVLVSGITHGGSHTPIGSAFAAGNAVSGACPTGFTLANNGCKSGDQLYTLTIQQSSVTFGEVLFEVKNSSGTIFSVPAGGTAGFTILNTSNNAVAQSTFAAGTGFAMGASWSTYNPGAIACHGGPCSGGTSLGSVYSISLDMGKTAASWVAPVGLTFVVVGTGAYQGTTIPVSLH